MTTLLTAVFVASLIGSLHCAGMCGPLLACAVAGRSTSGSASFAELGDGFGRATRTALWWSRCRPQAAYHTARLFGYTALGAAAGAVGGLLNLGGVLAGLQPVAAVMAGVAIMLVGVATMAPALRGRLHHTFTPAWLSAAFGKAHAKATAWPAVPRAAVIGLCTGLLPCGWLYAFVLAAAGTAQPLHGALVMAAFWLGTVPILLTLGVGLQGLLGIAGRRLPFVTGAAMIVIGALTVSHRLALDPVAMAGTVTARQAARHDPTEPGASSALPACCALSDAGKAEAPNEDKSEHDHVH